MTDQAKWLTRPAGSTIEYRTDSAEFKGLLELYRLKGSPSCVQLFNRTEKDAETQGLFTSGDSIRRLFKGEKIIVTEPQLQALTRLLDEHDAPDLIENWKGSARHEALQKLRLTKGNPSAGELFECLQKKEEIKALFKNVSDIGNILFGSTKNAKVSKVAALEQILNDLPNNEIKAEAITTAINNWPESDEFKKLLELYQLKGSPSCAMLFNRAPEDLFTSGESIRRLFKGEKLSVTQFQLQTLTRLLDAQATPDLIENWKDSARHEALKNLRLIKGNPSVREIFECTQKKDEIKALFKNESDVDSIIFGRHKTAKAPFVAALEQTLNDLPNNEIKAEAITSAINNWPESDEYIALKKLYQQTRSTTPYKLFTRAPMGLFTSEDSVRRIFKGEKMIVTQLQLQTLTRLLDEPLDKKMRTEACAEEVTNKAPVHEESAGNEPAKPKNQVNGGVEKLEKKL
jgi:hypothetical protein